MHTDVSALSATGRFHDLVFHYLYNSKSVAHTAVVNLQIKFTMLLNTQPQKLGVETGWW